MPRFLTNPWTIGIATTTIGTVVGGWLLGFHWSDLAPIWSAFADIALYLSGTVQIHRWTLLALLVGLLGFAVGLAYVVAWRYRRSVESVLRASLTVAAATPAAPAAAPPVPAAAAAAPQVIADFEPNRIQLIAAKVLIDQYPRRFQLPDLASAMARFAGGALPAPVAPQGEVARQLEDMHQRGIVTINDPESQVAYYGLTRHGRDFMLEKWKASARRPARPFDPTTPSGPA